MKVLMISGDREVFESKGDVARRLALQRSQVEQLDVFGYKGIMSGPWGFFQVLYIAMNTKYNVITSQEPFWRGLLAWFAANISGARLNVQVHADINAQFFVKRVLARFVLHRADSIRVVSERVKKQIEKMKVKAPITVLPVHVDLGPFRSLERIPDAQPTILWLGRFEDEKDPLRAIRVLKQVREKIVEARLVMLGAGSMEPRLRAAAKGLPVVFPGWKSPIEYLPKAHVVLSTSRAESWGVSIVEALASGVPVVAPDVGVAREAGAVVVSKDKLADAIIEVLQTKPLGELKMSVLTENEWKEKWKESLV